MEKRNIDPSQVKVMEKSEPKAEEPQTETPTQEPQLETPQPEAPQSETSQAEAPQVESSAQSNAEELQRPYETLTQYGSPEEIAQRLKQFEELAQDPRLVALNDEGAKKVLDAYTSGKLDEYVRIQNTDYDTMSDQAVFTEQVRREYPDASSSLVDHMVQERLQRFQAEDEDDPKAEILQERMRLEAQRLRDQYKKEKEEFEIPEFQLPTPEGQQRPSEEEVQQIRQQFLQQVRSERPVQQMYETKLVPTKIGEDTFNHEVQPDKITEMVTSPSAFINPVFARDESGNVKTDQNGNPIVDYARAIKAATFLSDMEGYERRLVAWAKGQGQKEVVDGMENPRENNKPAGDALAGKDYSYMDDRSKAIMKAIAEGKFKRGS
jgi:hypothetical protein